LYSAEIREQAFQIVAFQASLTWYNNQHAGLGVTDKVYSPFY
jgi:hypothetical protein